jgi:hypothetical protein
MQLKNSLTTIVSPVCFFFSVSAQQRKGPDVPYGSHQVLGNLNIQYDYGTGLQ